MKVKVGDIIEHVDGGLRCRVLRSGRAGDKDPFVKVLSVDPNGKFKYIDDGAEGYWGMGNEFIVVTVTDEEKALGIERSSHNKRKEK